MRLPGLRHLFQIFKKTRPLVLPPHIRSLEKWDFKYPVLINDVPYVFLDASIGTREINLSWTDLFKDEAKF